MHIDEQGMILKPTVRLTFFVAAMLTLSLSCWSQIFQTKPNTGDYEVQAISILKKWAGQFTMASTQAMNSSSGLLQSHRIPETGAQTEQTIKNQRTYMAMHIAALQKVFPYQYFETFLERMGKIQPALEQDLSTLIDVKNLSMLPIQMFRQPIVQEDKAKATYIKLLMAMQSTLLLFHILEFGFEKLTQSSTAYKDEISAIKKEVADQFFEQAHRLALLNNELKVAEPAIENATGFVFRSLYAFESKLVRLHPRVGLVHLTEHERFSRNFNFHVKEVETKPNPKRLPVFFSEFLRTKKDHNQANQGLCFHLAG